MLNVCSSLFGYIDTLLYYQQFCKVCISLIVRPQHYVQFILCRRYATVQRNFQLLFLMDFIIKVRATNRKFTNFVEAIPNKVQRVLQMVKRHANRNRQQGFPLQNRTSCAEDKMWHGARKNAVELRLHAMMEREELERRLKELRSASRLHEDTEATKDVTSYATEGSSRAHLMFNIQKELEDVNKAIRTLSFYLTQNAGHGLSKKNEQSSD